MTRGACPGPARRVPYCRALLERVCDRDHFIDHRDIQGLTQYRWHSAAQEMSRPSTSGEARRHFSTARRVAFRSADQSARLVGMAPDPGQRSWQKTADHQCGVISIRAAVAAGTTRSAIRWRVRSGRWQRPLPGVLVTRPGPLTRMQLLWCALESIGPGAVLGGACAAALGGLHGFDEESVTVLVPPGRRPGPRPGVVIRHSAQLGPADVCPRPYPPRTRLARSVVDMADWAARPQVSHAVLAAAVHQRLTTVAELRDVTRARGPIRQRNLITKILSDLERVHGSVPIGCQDGTLNNARSGRPSVGRMIPTQEYGSSALSSTATPLAAQSERI